MSDFSILMIQVYKSPNDIDLYPAGLAEAALPGGILGPTFSHMIGDQFRVIKDGDRFFYTHSKGPGAGGYPTDIQVAYQLISKTQSN